MKYIFLSIALAFLLYLPCLSFAQTSANVPGGQKSTAATPAGASQNFLTSMQNIYWLGLSLVGISALFVIVWGGFDYVTAGESESRATSGKNKIRNAVIGILVAAVSYALLNTINPDLVKLRLNPAQSIPPP
ncbi:MAG: hypothetical protein A3C11_01630 [Candidatus Sungbacteria bacterium RIFCSPHIGHO2_02_FULL_49_12]|uniref:Uncharacterized protein n=1 Tax=Candidatus Sungbacteria bacterium RIFCSPHIGHO2_02_FULL_49_12 TaxID=1802271 RepID=A0A1G2KQL9_9BACT|nr:MAG: hypothetical protein A3C11_01630 [Candidatus Sungbacteria bacterium RIFCSPHIGHO2_02_FULL_49_12]